MTTAVLHTILYVPDQDAARAFWAATLATEPTLDVPGMTEFTVAPGAVLGLMPARDVAALLPALAAVGGPAEAPAAELYLLTPDAPGCHARAIAVGATELSPMLRRTWGDDAAYSRTPDGHVVAFATRG